MEVVSGDNWSCKTCKAPVRSSPPTNQHPTFYRPDVVPVAQPTVLKHRREFGHALHDDGKCAAIRMPPGHGKSWNLGRPFSRPGKSWKIAKVMESNGKVMEHDDNVMEFLLLHCKSDTTSFIESNYEPIYFFVTMVLRADGTVTTNSVMHS